LAGHLRLGRLIVLYDDNKITIDGSTDLAFSENVLGRYQSYGWHTSVVQNGNSDLDEIDRAIREAKMVIDRPSIIAVRTTIGYLSTKQGTANVHGSPLASADLQNVKKLCGLNPAETFQIPEDVLQTYRNYGAIGHSRHEQWRAAFNRYSQQYPKEAAEFTRRVRGDLPLDCFESLPRYTPANKPIATRELSGEVLNILAARIPEIVGGCADLSPSTKTELSCSHDFRPETPGGRHIRYGVREHAMCAIMNGLHTYGGFIPYGATFLVFLTYCLPPVRLASLSKHQGLYIFTHDSIGLGEDGPTHQPVEVLQMARSIPGLSVIRPADGNEVVGAYICALKKRDGPTLLSLTRHNVPHLEHSSAEAVARGGYVVHTVPNPRLILVASGSEVSLSIDAAKLFEYANVVSMPCTSLFDEQPLEYRESVFPPGIPILSVEASSPMGWEKYAHAHVCMTTFGASGKASDLFKMFGFTTGNIVERAKEVVENFKGQPAPCLTRRLIFSNQHAH